MTYTLEDTVSFATRAVAERGPDWSYPAGKDTEWREEHGICVYHLRAQIGGGWEPTDQPACIVGHVLWQIGKLDEVGEGVAAEDQAVVKTNFDEPSCEFLKNLQTAQDGRFTWGGALQRALVEANDR